MKPRYVFLYDSLPLHVLFCQCFSPLPGNSLYPLPSQRYLPFLVLPQFWGMVGCFGHFLGSGGSTYEQNYVGLQGIKIKHRKNHLKNCSIISLIPGPIPILYCSLCPGLVYELLDLLLHPKQQSAGQCFSLVISFVGHVSTLLDTTMRKKSSTEHTRPASERSQA